MNAENKAEQRAKVLIFAGTTEGRLLSERLSSEKIVHELCVATEYGELVLHEDPLCRVHRGRLNAEQMRALIKECGCLAVVDATHPYAQEATRTIREAIKGQKALYLRLLRDSDPAAETDGARWFSSNEECCAALLKTEGNILLTTGSKELSCYCKDPALKERLYVRVLPGTESIGICEAQGIAGKQIIAMQGPFSLKMNEAILEQYGIRHLVTKESGGAGGFAEKLSAAKNCGAQAYVIGRPKEEGGLSFGEVCRRLDELCAGKNSRREDDGNSQYGSRKSMKGSIGSTDRGKNAEAFPLSSLEVVLAGIGMGSRQGLTKETADAVSEADLVLGASRMLELFPEKQKKYACYLSDQILPKLKALEQEPDGKMVKKAAVLFSGDSGFYSGTQVLLMRLQEEIVAGKLNASVRVLPGISSVSYLAAKTGESWQDARICSMHGKKLMNLGRKIAGADKTYLLMSGAADVNRLGAVLEKSGLEDCKVIAGYRLSYPDEEILELTAKECRERKEEGLYTCLIKNPHPAARILTHGLPDEAFLRDKVPMTKEEVREVSICKLRLQKDSVLYDIGSGTGSIAAEAARLSDEICVFAIEQKEEAAALIEKNREQFGLENIEVICGKAPEALEGLPAATHAFIGGSGGKLQEMMERLYAVNPRMRVVINAVSMETICEIRTVLERFPEIKPDIVQIQASRARKLGSYHLMQAENPVWICSFTLNGLSDAEERKEG